MPEEDDINSLRYKLFTKQQNPNALPPTRDALYQHIKRSNLQSLICHMANIPRPVLPDPTECGYEMSDIGLKPILMTEDPIPNSALKIVSCNCKTNCNTNRCGCRKVGLSCNLHCGCTNSCSFVSCNNSPGSFNEND